MIVLGVCPTKTFGQQPARRDTLQILDLSTLLAELATNNPSLRAARLEADALVLATANVAETALAEDLVDSGLELHTIGDALAPRRAHTAIYEGRKVGLSL